MKNAAHAHARLVLMALCASAIFGCTGTTGPENEVAQDAALPVDTGMVGDSGVVDDDGSHDAGIDAGTRDASHDDSGEGDAAPADAGADASDPGDTGADAGHPQDGGKDGGHPPMDGGGDAGMPDGGDAGVDAGQAGCTKDEDCPNKTGFQKICLGGQCYYYDPCDQDQDGVKDNTCGGPDCDPKNKDIPIDHEICGNGVDDDCNKLTDGEDPACIPKNDTCATAQTIQSGDHVSASTDGASKDYGPTCGPDVIYTFTAAGPVEATVTMTVLAPTPPQTVPVQGVEYEFYVDKACPPSGTGNWCRCSNGQYCNGQVPLTYAACYRYTAGDYYIAVKGGPRNGSPLNPKAGWPFALDLSLVASPVPACGLATDISAGGVFPLDPADARWVNAFGACGVDGSEEAIFLLTLAAPKNVLLSVTGSGGEEYLLDACDPFAARRAEWPPQFNLGPGAYFLVQELYGTQPGATLEVTLTDQGAACAGADQITGTGSLSGTTAGRSNQIVAGGGHGLGPEKVYRLDLTDAKRVVGDLIPSYTGAILYYEKECGVNRTSSFSSFRARHFDETLQPGTYFIIVDGDAAGDAGDYVLNVTILPPA